MIRIFFEVAGYDEIKKGTENSRLENIFSWIAVTDRSD
jgi:hypothetical protein